MKSFIIFLLGIVFLLPSSVKAQTTLTDIWLDCGTPGAGTPVTFKWGISGSADFYYYNLVNTFNNQSVEFNYTYNPSVTFSQGFDPTFDHTFTVWAIKDGAFQDTETISLGCGTSVASDNFENGWGNWNDGGWDCRRVTNNSNCPSGNDCLRLRDNSSGSDTESDDFDLSSFQTIRVEFSFFSVNLNNGNDLRLYHIDENEYGTSITQKLIGEWSKGTDFHNDVTSYKFVDIAGCDLPDKRFGAINRFKFESNCPSNSEKIYLDDIIITGCDASGNLYRISDTDEPLILSEAPSGKSVNNSTESNLRTIPQVSELLVYPNPASHTLNVINPFTNQQLGVEILNAQGQLVKSFQVDSAAELLDVDVSTFSSGFYFLKLQTEKEKAVKKFIVDQE